MTSVGDTYVGRFLVWLASSAAILGITFALLGWWMEQFPDRSDFQTNEKPAMYQDALASWPTTVNPAITGPCALENPSELRGSVP